MEADQALVVVSRRREFLYSARGFDVLIDRHLVARLQSGSRVEGAVAPGSHTLQIRVGRKSSEQIAFDAIAGERIDFLAENSDAFGWRPVLAADPHPFELTRTKGAVPELGNTWSRRGTALQFVALLFLLLGIINGIIDGSVTVFAVYFAVAVAAVAVAVILRTGRFEKSQGESLTHTPK